MRILNTVQVDASLLNEIGTLAAPSMLRMAYRAACAELGSTTPPLALHCYQATFKQGAREGDAVTVSLDDLSAPDSVERTFRVFFSPPDQTDGRIGQWQLTFAGQGDGRLPYDITQAQWDRRTDDALWRPDLCQAQGEADVDGPALLWLAGQSARAYFKRLDDNWVDAGGATQDDPETRRYAGIAVTMTLNQWPTAGMRLRCAVDYYRPLQTHPKPSKRLDFQGFLVEQAMDESTSWLLGTFRFTIVRVNTLGTAIYPDGSA